MIARNIFRRGWKFLRYHFELMHPGDEEAVSLDLSQTCN
jgi:hypothetical protein